MGNLQGYTICSSRSLCWTCSEHNFLPKVLNVTEKKPPSANITAHWTARMAGVIIPGMKLQPFLPNQTREYVPFILYLGITASQVKKSIVSSSS